MTVRYLAEALAEYEAAAAWYDERDPAAGDGFVEAIERAEAMICEVPLAWAAWPGARTGIRRYLLPYFPYAIAYELRGEEVVILAVAHQRRRPGYWFSREG